MRDKLPFMFILLAAILWGTTGTTQALAPEDTHPVGLGAVRLAVGGGFLFLFVLLTRKLSLKNWPFKVTLISALSMACYQPLFFSAVSMTGVAIGTVIAIGSAPILSGFIEWRFLKKNPTRKWWGATGISILGCLLLFMKAGSVQVDVVGVVLALGAGLSFAVYTIVSKELVQQYSPISVVAVVFTLSAIMLSPFLFIIDLTSFLSVRGVIVSLHLGLLATGLAYVLFSKGLTAVPSSTAVTLSLAEPLTAALLAVVLVGERLSIVSWFGIALLFMGIMLLTSGSKVKTGREVKTI
ncbi:DMT family transporter [Bacillus sp. AK128]